MLSRYNDGQRDFIIVADQFSCPTYAPDLAEAIFEVLKTGWSRSIKTYHLQEAILFLGRSLRKRS